MKKFQFKKRFITLVEMMIVMFLIAMITGVIAYNYTGSLEEGKAFKTKAGIEKIKTILALDAASGDIDNIKDGWKEIIKNSPLVQNADELIKDGWGAEYEVDTGDEEGEKVVKVTSKKYEAYNVKKKTGLFNK
ncbi:MAG: general secretion pathway protein GspG [Parachlamydiaceae bacterium]|nr:general secretion pathway protein GspG [Parachlamydiaceae bacterium]